jgi:cbb3-type cytochrome oxidase subunit 1
MHLVGICYKNVPSRFMQPVLRSYQLSLLKFLVLSDQYQHSTEINLRCILSDPYHS